jgi:hypothetical protein
MELHGREMVDMFASRSAKQKELLANATLRTPDITFDTEAKIDLGGVMARLLWFGGTPSSWLIVLDKAAALNALHVLRRRVDGCG